MSNSAWRFLAFAALALAGVAGGAWWWSKPTAVVVPVQRGRIVEVVPATLNVRAEYLLELRSEAGGRVRGSALRVGASLRAGDEALQVDDADLRLQSDALERDLATARRKLEVGFAGELDLTTAREQLAKSERLLADGAVAPADVEQQRRTVRQLEQQLQLSRLELDGQIAALETALEAKRRAIAQTRLLAPGDGQVLEVLAHPGDLIEPGAVVARVLSAARVVEARVAEENFAGVRVGQAASVRFLGYGAEQFTARVQAVLPAADPETRRYTVHLAVDIAPERLVPGLSGEAVIVVGTRENVLTVPRRALAGGQVFVVEAGRVQARAVVPGYASVSEVQLVEGVQEGELVIVETPETFRAGERVRTQQR